MNTDTLDTETRTKLARILRQYAQGIITDSRVYQEICTMLLERHIPERGC